MFEDDIEPEDQQPAEIRDRETPGRGGSGVRRGGGRRNGTRSPAAPRKRVKAEMPDAAKPPRDLLEEILGKMGVPHAEIEYLSRPEGEYFEVTGPDLAMLIGRHGNT